MNPGDKPNPFQPPRASLDVPIERGPRPRRVKLAVGILVASLGLNVLLAAAPWIGLMPLIPGETVWSDASGTLFNIALLGLLAQKMWQGRNWARWFFLVLGVFGLLGIVSMLALVPAVSKVLSGLRLAGALVQTMLQCAVVVLAFTGESRAWFRGSG